MMSLTEAALALGLSYGRVRGLVLRAVGWDRCGVVYPKGRNPYILATPIGAVLTALVARYPDVGPVVERLSSANTRD